MFERKLHMVMIGLLLLAGINCLFSGLYETDVLLNNTGRSFTSIFYLKTPEGFKIKN